MAAGRDLFNELPQETRLQIFRLATIKPSQAEDTRAEYRPFDAVALRDRDWSNSNQTALSVKAAIVLVCKEWKSIATEMLYECIRIRHGTHTLLSALESTRYSTPDNNVASAGSPGVEYEYDYGRWVRRVEISPEIIDFDPFNPYPILRILQCCPLVQTIVRSSMVLGSGGIALGFVRLPFGETFPTFPNIKRIDWWLSGIASLRSRSAPGSVYGFLGELVLHSPKLEYLTLSGCEEGHFGHFGPKITVDPFGRNGPFRSLTTLRLEGDSVDFMPSLLLPNLHRLVLGGGVYAGIKKILTTYGHQIRVLEFIIIHSPSPTPFHVSHTDPVTTIDILKACPNLEELNAHLRTGDVLFHEARSARLQPRSIPLHLLKSIRIHFDNTPLLGATTSFGNFIRQYLQCPALESVVLCGTTRQAWKESPVFPILEKFISETRFSTLEFQEP